MFPTNLQSPASDAEKLKHYYDTQKISDYPKTALGMPDMRSTINRNMIHDLLVARCCDEIEIPETKNKLHAKLQDKHQKVLEEKRYMYNGQQVNVSQWFSILFKEYAKNISEHDHDEFMKQIHIGLYETLWQSSIDTRY